MQRVVRILTLAVALSAAGCAHARHAEPVAPPDSPARAEPVASPRPGGEAATGPQAPAAPVEPAQTGAREEERGPCELSRLAGDRAVDAARRGLYQTTCRAALWFDGLFGEERHPAAASNATGRVELSSTYSQYYGARFRGRFNARVRLPNLEKGAEAFFGRDEKKTIVEDREEGFALRSQFLGLEEQDRWVAGLGYSLPGTYRQRADFRVGVSGSTAPEIFVQARNRNNWYMGKRDLWHVRETAFWSNRDGFGATASADFDHLFTRVLLVRWGSIGTFSEATHGMSWRSALVAYQDLHTRRAMAYELFIRGETDAPVGVKEYGSRVVYRQAIFHRPWLFGELIGGYSWPREKIRDLRRGSAVFGFGLELLFGRDENSYY